jgi:hypothetical protein
MVNSNRVAGKVWLPIRSAENHPAIRVDERGFNGWCFSVLVF